MKGRTTIYRADGSIEERDWTEMPGLKFLQEAVHGYIEEVPLWPVGVAFCNEEGKLNGLPLNRQAQAIWEQNGPLRDYLVGDIVQITGDAEFMAEL